MCEQYANNYNIVYIYAYIIFKILYNIIITVIIHNGLEEMYLENADLLI